MVNNILKGLIYITDDVNVVYQFPIGPMNKIINLDEDDVLPENNSIVGGTCLLPPIDAKIAEADGDEILYNSRYIDHLQAPYQQQFIAALLSFLFKGGNLLLFLPELGYTNTRDKFIAFMYMLYGIHIGIMNNPDPNMATCYYDSTAIPIWLNLIYCSGVISAKDYLLLMPEDASVVNNDRVIDMLMMELKPYGETIKSKLDSIVRMHKAVHKNPNTVTPIRSLE